jgi:hypothetical protein
MYRTLFIMSNNLFLDFCKTRFRCFFFENLLQRTIVVDHYFFLHLLGNDHLTWRGGVMVFFLKKYSDSQCCWKKYSDFGGGKKKSDSEFLSYNLMLNSGKKFRALCNIKNKYSNSCVVWKKNSEWNKKS